MANEQASRREVLKKAAYVTPAILTLQAIPSFASNGSVLTEEKDKEKGRGRTGNSSSHGTSPGITPSHFPNTFMVSRRGTAVNGSHQPIAGPGN